MKTRLNLALNQEIIAKLEKIAKHYNVSKTGAISIAITEMITKIEEKE